MVAYFDRHTNKWHRAIVDYIYDLLNAHEDEELYILWLVDYGYPVQAHQKSLKKLQQEFLQPACFGNVIKAGIGNIIPCKKIFDFESDCMKEKVADAWDSSTLKDVQMMLQNALSITFNVQTQIDGHTFGDVSIDYKGKIHNIRGILEKYPYVMDLKSREFFQTIQKLNTTNIERYKDNQGHSIGRPKEIKNRSPSINKSTSDQSMEYKNRESHFTNNPIDNWFKTPELKHQISPQNSHQEYVDDEDELPGLVSAMTFHNILPTSEQNLRKTGGLSTTHNNYEDIPRKPKQLFNEPNSNNQPKYKTEESSTSSDISTSPIKPLKNAFLAQKLDTEQLHANNTIAPKMTRIQRMQQQIQKKMKENQKQKHSNVSTSESTEDEYNNKNDDVILPACYDTVQNQEVRPSVSSSLSSSKSQDDNSSIGGDSIEGPKLSKIEKILKRAKPTKVKNLMETSSESNASIVKPRPKSKMNELIDNKMETEEQIKFNLHHKLRNEMNDDEQ